MRTLVIIISISLLFICTSAAPAFAEEKGGAYNRAYSLVPTIYPNIFSSPEFARKVQGTIQETVAQAANQASGNNPSHPCYASTVTLITQLYNKHYALENIRGKLASTWADRYTATQMNSIDSYFTSPLVLRLNRADLKTKPSSLEEMNRDLVASGQFSESEIEQLEALTSRDIYEFNKKKSADLSDVIAKVKQDINSESAQIIAAMRMQVESQDQKAGECVLIKQQGA